MCLYPRLIKNRKYTANKKNGGNIPPINDIRTLLVPIGCGNCMECRKQKSREWQTRLLEDIKTNNNAKFITLTFSDESYAQIASNFTTLSGYELDNAIATQAVRWWLERWRKKYKKTIRHWLVTELGHNGTKNIHLHGLIWTDYTLEEIEAIWQYGWMWKYKIEKGKKVNYVNDRTIGYITKYVTKQDIEHKTYKPVILTSPGIGHNYTQNTKGDWQKNKYNGTETRTYYRTQTGHKISLPIYWRNKIYTDEQKEELWIQQLNKQERYINGKKIDVSNKYNEYHDSLQWARKLNNELGYGSNHIDWDKIQYEENLRIIQQQTRIQKGTIKSQNKQIIEINKQINANIKATKYMPPAAPAAGG